MEAILPMVMMVLMVFFMRIILSVDGLQIF